MRTVSAQESEAYAASIHALHVGTSAKTGLGLQDIFQAIADQVVVKSPEQGIVFCLHKPSDHVASAFLHSICSETMFKHFRTGFLLNLNIDMIVSSLHHMFLKRTLSLSSLSV